MRTSTPRARTGLTLIELMVSIGIIALLLATLLPAILSGHHASRRAVCVNNLKNLGLAIENHAQVYQALPPLYHGGFLPQPRSAIDEFHFHSWRTAILPFMEQSPLYAQLNINLPATVPANQTALNTRLDLLICPESIHSRSLVPEIAAWNDGAFPVAKVGTAAYSDYEAIAGVQVAPQTKSSSDLSVIRFGAWGEPTYDTTTGASLRYRQARLSDITDGLSNTILVVEKAGRPDLRRKGQPALSYPYSPTEGGEHHQAAWGISTHIWWLVLPQNQPVNTSNMTGIYAFHHGGANVAMADGSVRFLKESTPPALLKALVTRSDGEIETLD